jgi:hypothetical protein
VQITSRSTRYIVLFHCVLSFFFNTAILAMSVNIIAGLTWDDSVAALNGTGSSPSCRCHPRSATYCRIRLKKARLITKMCTTK